MVGNYDYEEKYETFEEFMNSSYYAGLPEKDKEAFVKMYNKDPGSTLYLANLVSFLYDEFKGMSSDIKNLIDAQNRIMNGLVTIGLDNIIKEIELKKK